MRYEDLKHILKHGLLIDEDFDGVQGSYFDGTKVSLKELQEEFGDLNKFFNHLAEFDPRDVFDPDEHQ